MRDVRISETEAFPRFGARARAWRRFERDLRGWLETPEGRFALWRATTGAVSARLAAEPPRPE